MAMKIVHGPGEEDLNAQSPNLMPLTAATIIMCASCERLATNTTIKTIPPRLISEFPYNHSAVVRT